MQTTVPPSPKPSPLPAAAPPDLLERREHLHAAGIDVGATELVAAVPAGRDPRPVRTFGSFTGELHRLRDWLLACGIATVALESTGNYWIALYQVLEDAGLEVWLVNAQQVKGCGRRKTDVSDAQWLQQLHAAGLLRKSFRPAREIVPLRYLLRHRAQLVQSASRELHHLQKVSQEMNLHLHHVLSDLDSQSGLAILRAILAGERDAQKLADLRDARCRTPRAKVVAALEADYRDEYLFVLRQCLARWEQTQASLRELDAQLATWVAAVAAPCPAPAAGTLRPKAAGKNALRLPVEHEAWRFYGVDLTAIEGVSSGTVATLMTELGTGEQIAAAFLSGRAFASWLGLCPDNRISGGKILRAKTRKVQSRVATAFRLAANALGHSKGVLGDYCRRMKGRLGKAEGITAAAHKLARIVYALVTTRQEYDPARAFALTPAKKAQRIMNLQRQAAKLGYALIAQPSPA
jgi:transposase